jgi:hypothetical protein
MTLPQNSENLDLEQPIFSVEFANTLEDFKKLLDFTFNSNINNQKKNLLILCFLCFFMLNVLFVILRLPLNLYENIAISAFFSVILYLIITKIRTWIGLKNIQKIPQLFLSHKIDFFENYTIFKTVKDQSIRNYEDFKKLYETKDYLFLMVNEIQALTFPKKYFTDQQINFIKTKIKI